MLAELSNMNFLEFSHYIGVIGVSLIVWDRVINIIATCKTASNEERIQDLKWIGMGMFVLFAVPLAVELNSKISGLN